MEGISEAEQLARSQLRERFLRLLSHLSGGVGCEARMYDNLDYTCTVKAFDSNFENMIVENLITPTPKPIPKAILRLSDILFMNFDISNIRDFS